MKSSKELKRIAREKLTGNYRIPMGALIIVTLLPSLIEFPFSSLLKGETASQFQNIIYYIAVFLIQLLAGVLNIGLTLLFLNMGRGKEFAQNQIYYCFRNRSEFYVGGYFIKLLAEIISGLPIILCFFFLGDSTQDIVITICCGLLSLILILIFNLVYGLLFYVMLDNENLSVIECYRLSRQLIRGHKLQLLYIYLSFIGLLILCVLSLGLGLLLVEPYRQLTLVNFYLQIIEPDKEPEFVDPIYRGQTIDTAL